MVYIRSRIRNHNMLKVEKKTGTGKNSYGSATMGLVWTVFDLCQADVHGAAARHQVHGVANIHPLQLWRQPAGGISAHQTFPVSLLPVQGTIFRYNSYQDPEEFFPVKLPCCMYKYRSVTNVHILYIGCECCSSFAHRLPSVQVTYRGWTLLWFAHQADHQLVYMEFLIFC